MTAATSRVVAGRGYRPFRLQVNNVTVVTDGPTGALLCQLKAKATDGRDIYPNQWVPKSQLHADNKLELKQGASGVLTVNHWWAEGLGLKGYGVKE